jgi:hypothetical protein
MIGIFSGRVRRTLGGLGLLAPLVMSLATPAPARDNEAMTFTLGRFDGSPSCGPPCAQFIVAEGQIEQFSSFSYLIARKRTGDRDLPVLLTSPGGYVAGADRLARVWRKLGVTAIIANVSAVCDTSPNKKWAGAKDCVNDPGPSAVQTFRLVRAGAKCASACTLLVAGATKRIATNSARIGLHSSHVDPNTDVARLAARLGNTNDEVVRYVEKGFRESLESLGIDPELADRATRTPSDKMEWITPEEARRYRLFNATIDDATLSVELREALAKRR